MKISFQFSLKLMIAFLVSDLVVVYCHMRNPFMGFLSTRSSYLLFVFSFISIVVFVIQCIPPRRKP